MRALAEFFADVRACLHAKADRLRGETYGRCEQLRGEGLPDRYIDQHGRLALAQADFLDALSTHPILRLGRKQ